jgi:pimeloyl-ACP methyl ester carboxylesterase
MRKIVYLVPGYGESHLKERGWSKVAKLFEAKGITPIHVDINWKRNSPERFSDYTDDFLKEFKKPKNTEIFVLGFSFGANIAFLTAAQTKPKALILCSLSPYFEEDLPRLKPQWVKWWKKAFVASDYSFAKIASKVKSRTYLIVEDVDAKEISYRARDAKKKLRDASLVIAKGAKHRIIQKEYMAALERVINRL